MHSRDFEESLHGFGQYFKCGDSKHGKLVIPEALVVSETLDAASRKDQKGQNMNQGTYVNPQLGNEDEMIQQLRERSEKELV